MQIYYIISKCNSAETREELAQFLSLQSIENIRLAANKLSIRTSGNRTSLIEKIVESTVGSRLRTKAILGTQNK